VVPVVLLPARVAVLPDVELRHRGGRERRAQGDDAERTVGVASVELECVPGADGQPDQDGAVDAGRIHHGQRVVDVLDVGVGLLSVRPVGATVPPALDGDHAEVPGEERHLHPPLAHVHDRPRGEQDDARAVGVSVAS
jgi:hypothetical protein